MSHGNLVKWKSQELKCKNCNWIRNWLKGSDRNSRKGKYLDGGREITGAPLGYFSRLTLFNIFSNGLDTKNRNVMRKSLMLQMVRIS